MPPLNPNLTASLQEKDGKVTVKVEEQPQKDQGATGGAISAQVNCRLALQEEKTVKSTGYREEINANHVPFPSEESFHLPEPLSKGALDEHNVQSSLDCKSRKVFEYVAKGEFDVVWPNVIVFSIGHMLHLYCLYILMTDTDVRTQWTWIWSKYWPQFAVSNCR